MAFDQRDSPLVSVFLDHEFDIVGLARVPTDDTTRRLSLRRLGDILRYKLNVGTESSETLANILFAMTTIALDYADDGHCGYWGKLAVAIRQVAGHGMELDTDIDLRILLGKSYNTALKHFGYARPDKSPHKYVSTILFHAGIPRPALQQVLRVIVKALWQHGSQAINLNSAQRRTLLKNNIHLQENVRRLLASDWTGADELWKCLARVVRAWQQFEPNWELELQRLPTPALDQEKVRDALKAIEGPEDNVLFIEREGGN